MTNKFLEAFKEGGNVIGIAATVAVSAVLLNPEPLLIGLVAETVYLLFVPDTRWYRSRLAEKSERDVVGRRRRLTAQTLPLLRPDLRRRCEWLAEVRRQIEAQGKKDPSVGGDLREKLDDLHEKFLAFALKEQEFRNYLQSLLVASRGTVPRPGPATQVPNVLPSTMPDDWIPQAIGEVQADYTRALSQLQQTIANESDENSHAILQKRADVLVRRQEYVVKMGRTLTNLSYQLQLVEDTFGLINDEIRARSPEQVLSDIDEVVTQTDVMARTLAEIAPLDQMIARVG